MGGNAKTLMFCNVAPDDYNIDETLTSLSYASRVKMITNKVSKNVDHSQVDNMKKLVEKLVGKKDFDVSELLQMDDGELRTMITGKS
jgi:hypothetical protein